MIPDPWCVDTNCDLSDSTSEISIAIFQVNGIAHKESYYISFFTFLVCKSYLSPTLFPILLVVKSYKSWICILSDGVQGSVHPSCNHWNLWRYKSVATCPTSWGRGCSWAPTWPRSCRGTLTDFWRAKKSQNLPHRLVVALSVVDSVLSGSCGSPSFKIPAPIMSFSSPSQFAFS